MAERDVLAVVAAPGDGPAERGLPASALIVELKRAQPRAEVDLELPPPLAEPRLDFRVDKASALAYEVREGEYIQIIDVKGKQCSDFLAFNEHKLQAGLERGLDGVTTRTLMGTAVPTPGLYAKFYDVDQDPLVEKVQDTVGRHDMFALACQPKYYEDLGYPGHISCTENFNAQVTPYGIAERAGLGGAQLLLQHQLRPRPPAGDGRALVAPRRLRAAAGHERSRVRLVGLPGRHRSRQRLGDHRRPRSRLSAREPLSDGHRPPRDPGGRASADQGDGVPPADRRAHQELRRSTAATGSRTATTTRAGSPSTGPAARRPW